MQLPYRIGFLSSLSLSLVGIAYIVVVVIGISQAGLHNPIVDPILAIMELLTLLSAPLIVAVMAAIYETAEPDRRILGLLAIIFAGIMAGLTGAVHFVALTSGRQTDFTVLQWPSTLYAVELLAWDVFLGLSLLCAAFVFRGSGIRGFCRWSLFIAGALSLVGVIGPATGDMALQRIGIVGYGVVLPVAMGVLAWLFRRHSER